MITRKNHRALGGTLITVLVTLLLIGGLTVYVAMKLAAPKSTASGFAAKVDLSPLNACAVQAGGRLRAFESHAKAVMLYVYGPKPLDGQPNGYTYLDLMFRPELYQDRDLLYVKKKPVLAQLLNSLESAGVITEEQKQDHLDSKLIPPAWYNHPVTQQKLAAMEENVIKYAKPVNSLRYAVNSADPRHLVSELRFIAPPSGKQDDPWIGISELTGAPMDSTHANMGGLNNIAGLDPELQRRISVEWIKLREAWRAQDAEQVNKLIVSLADIFHQSPPGLYPAKMRLSMESWYFKQYSLTWVWMIYLLSVVPLLISVIYRWNAARVIGMTLFSTAFIWHTIAVFVRFYVSGRWPNSNMFEALTTAAWMAAAAAVVIELLAWRSPLRNLFALAASAASMFALMAAYFLPVSLDSSIRNKMAALNNTIWLYIHTNIVIWSYLLISMAAICALLYMGYRMIKAISRAPSADYVARVLVLPVSLVAWNFATYKLVMHCVNPVDARLSGFHLLLMGGVFILTMAHLLAELFVGRSMILKTDRLEYAVAGGAGAMMGWGGTDADSFVKQPGASLGQVLDAATMVLMELSFIMLWVGIILGAVWADASWGRPWGWDPKEVFALNTFFILIALVHVRLKVRDKGLWTAILAIIGAEVMIFNWVVINFIVTGLHSYA